MAAPVCAAQAFRFTDLPPEIRNQIYEILLCSFPVDAEYARYGAPIPDLGSWLDKSELTASVLRASRQIHYEARAVVIKENLFVQIECHMSKAHTGTVFGFAANHGMPIVAGDDKWTGKPTDNIQLDRYQPLLAMTYAIRSGAEVADSQSSTLLRFIILHRELDEFLLELALAEGAVLADFATSMIHQVTINTLDESNGSWDKIDRSFLGTRAVLERMLRPFANQFEGIKNFSVHTNALNGRLDEVAVASVTTAVKHRPQRTAPQILERVRALKDEGTVAYG